MKYLINLLGECSVLFGKHEQVTWNRNIKCTQVFMEEYSLDVSSSLLHHMLHSLSLVWNGTAAGKRIFLSTIAGVVFQRLFSIAQQGHSQANCLPHSTLPLATNQEGHQSIFNSLSCYHASLFSALLDPCCFDSHGSAFCLAHFVLLFSVLSKVN